MGCPSITTIQKNECIGNSLPTINNNFTSIKNEVCNNTADIGSLQVQYQTLVNTTNVLSAYTQQVIPTVLFVPVNYATQSNSNPKLVSWSSNSTQNTSSTPWWSGIQTATIPNVPSNTVGVLIEAWANVNSWQNNGQYIYIYRQEEQASVNPPNTNTTPGNITSTQFNQVNQNFLKLAIDPTGTTLGSYEGDSQVTIPVYLSPSNNQFRWFWIDAREGGAPGGPPDYGFTIHLLGYYVKIV
jgi:hypothetical protein